MNSIKAVDFQDDIVKNIILENYDFNNDGIISIGEIESVKSIGTVFKMSGIETFDEFELFTGVTAITDAFSKCQNLRSVKFPISLISISSTGNYASGEGAFSGTQIEVLDLRTVPSLSGPVLSTMPNLREIYLAEDFRLSGAVYKSCPNLSKIHIFDIYSFISKDYTTSGIWGNTCIASDHLCGLYVNNQEVTTISIPSSLHKIGNYALRFKTCRKIENGYNITSIGEGAFFNSMIEDFDMSNVSTIGASAFYNTQISLSKIPDKITALLDNTFFGCKNLQYLDINNCRSIGAYTFDGCTNLELDLEKLYSLNTEIHISTHAFYNCNKVTVSQNILDKIVSLGHGALYGCQVPEKCRLPNLVTCNAAFSANDTILKGYKFLIIGNKIKQFASFSALQTFSGISIFEDGGLESFIFSDRNRGGIISSQNDAILDLSSTYTSPIAVSLIANVSRGDYVHIILRSPIVVTIGGAVFMQYNFDRLKIYVYPDMVDTYKNSSTYSQVADIHPIGGTEWVSMLQRKSEALGINSEDIDWTDEFADYDLIGANKPEKDEEGVYKTLYHNNL